MLFHQLFYKLHDYFFLYESNFLCTCTYVTESLEEGTADKKERAPSADRYTSHPDQSLDERNGLNKEHETSLPPGFLSPSVREYLELGKSIPGKVRCKYISTCHNHSIREVI